MMDTNHTGVTRNMPPPPKKKCSSGPKFVGNMATHLKKPHLPLLIHRHIYLFVFRNVWSCRGRKEINLSVNL